MGLYHNCLNGSTPLISTRAKKKEKKNIKKMRNASLSKLMHRSQINFKELFLSWSCIKIVIMVLFVTKMLGGRFDYSMFYRLYILFILDKIRRY